MKVGDLVRVKRSDSDIRNRNSGIVLKFDTCFNSGACGKMQITEVLWQSGLSWIDSSRIEVLNNENR
ncbi:MAG: hypothetical protein H8E12_08995 [Rhodobacteraceae bacterium]|nr:hypothetical protein [Paracoccaceae bacterium]